MSNEMDDMVPFMKEKRLEFWLSMPFSIFLGVYALIQIFAAVSIFTFNERLHTTKSLYYSAIIGMLTSFSIGAFLAIQAS
jgi:hypothetical protein